MKIDAASVRIPSLEVFNKLTFEELERLSSNI
jgi:hypothetical protein